MQGALRLLLAGMIACSAFTAASAQQIVTYAAVYTLHYKGKEAGKSQFSVAAGNEPGTYRFLSNSKLRGLIARLVAPNAVIEDSEFRLTDGRVTPQHFRYEDGSRKGEDNYTIAFDWPATAALMLQGNVREIPLTAGVLDRGSAQVALMFDAARGAPAAGYDIIDDDGLESYQVTALDPRKTATGAGEFDTFRLAQQRIGSSRQTIFWLAPSLSHLPVRIEQIRNGEAETVFVLESVEFTGR